MSSQLAVQNKPAKEYFFKAISGNLKSTVYRLTKKEILIGRDSSNHIVITNDSKVSRRHARLIFHKNQYYIQNLTANNFITLNGEKTKQGVLFNNCVITVGGHSFKFVITEAAPRTQNQNSHLAAVPKSNTGISNKTYSQSNYSYQNNKVSVDQSSNKKVISIVMASLIALVLASSFLKSKPVLSPKPQEDIETNKRILERIRKSQAKIDAYKKNLDSTGKNNKNYKKIQRTLY